MMAVPMAKKLDRVASPPVTLLMEFHADNPLGLELLGLSLHPLHRELTRVIQSLGEVRQLNIAPSLSEGAQRASATDVVDAAAHDHPDRTVPGAQQHPEVLAR
jgi:hypothetical protein